MTKDTNKRSRQNNHWHLIDLTKEIRKRGIFQWENGQKKEQRIV